MIEIGWLDGPTVVLERLAFYPPSHFTGIVIVWSLGVMVPAIAIVITINLRRQWIRVTDPRIEARSFLRHQQVKWDELRWLSPVVHNRVSMTYYQGGKLFGSWGWLMDLTRDQAAAVLSHPKFPSKLLDRGQLAWALGT